MDTKLGKALTYCKRFKISKLINGEDIYSEPKSARIIKWLSKSCDKLVKRYEGEVFDNVFHD